MGLLLLVLLDVCGGEMGRTQGRWVPTEEEDKELERQLLSINKPPRQLLSINKPPIKTLQSKSGEPFDCIDMYKQPAFDNPLLRNHTLQLKPSSVPPSRVKIFERKAGNPLGVQRYLSKRNSRDQEKQ